MKWLIEFKGGVETQEYFSVELGKTFKMIGYQIYWYDLLLEEESAELLKQFILLHPKDTFAAFTINFAGLEGEPGLYQEGSDYNFWRETCIPVFNMVVDHPLYYQKYERYLPERYWQISIDRNHIKYLKRFCPEIKLAGDWLQDDGFVPLAGTKVEWNQKSVTEQKLIHDTALLPMEQRKIDVIFTGNYTPITQLDSYLQGMEQDYIDLYHELLQEAISHPDELIEDLAEKRLKVEIGQITDPQLKTCMPNMMYVDLAVRFHYRAEVIKMLVDHGIKVHLYGAGWGKLDCQHSENMILHGNVDSQKCLDMLAQSKISINVMPWFKDGAHDRIFNSMLNGAVSVSDGSRYLKQEFQNRKQIVYYDLKKIAELPGMIHDLLGDTSILNDIALNAYKQCSSRHTWQQRAERIVPWINQVLEQEL